MPDRSSVDGELRLTLVDQGPFASRDAALLAYNHALPSDLEILPWKADRIESGPRSSTSSGARRRSRAATFGVRGKRWKGYRPAVGFTLKADAAQRFGTITARKINRSLATVLDNRVMSVATIQSRIDDHGQIVRVSREEMIEQVINLNSGALPADLEYARSARRRETWRRVGSRRRAGVAGRSRPRLLFMLSYYRLARVNALISVVLNLLILLALMAYVPVTFTLPEIAGLILTIGMGVDSNV